MLWPSTAENTAPVQVIAGDLGRPVVEAVRRVVERDRAQACRLILARRPGVAVSWAEVRVAPPAALKLLREQVLWSRSAWFGARVFDAPQPGRMFEGLAEAEAQSYAQIFDGLWAAAAVPASAPQLSDLMRRLNRAA